jgi:hypothetical protein
MSQELGREWTSWVGWSGPRARKEKGKEKKESWAPGFRPSRGLENSKGFPFSNIFTKMKLIWIQFKFEFSNDSSHKIKSNNTHQYKN